MASGALSLEGIRATCAELSSVGRALADARSVALIVGSDGTLSFTPLCSRVMSEAPHPHPLHKMIVRACDAHHERTGHDCGSLLASLDELLRQAARLAGDLGDSAARRTLLAELPSFEALVLPGLFRKVRDAAAVVSAVADAEAFGRRLGDLVRSRSEDLRGVVCEFVRRGVPDWSGIAEALDYYVDNFEEACCSRGEESAVLEGFLLKADRSKEVAGRFVVVMDVSVKAEGVIWVGDAVWRVWSRIEASLNDLKDRGVFLILSPSAAPPRLHSLCAGLEISLVDRLSSGDLRNIQFFTGVVPLDTLCDPVEAECVSRIDSSRPFGGRFLHLRVPPSAQPFAPCHVVLHAPSQAVWQERRAEFVDCLRVLRQWLHPPGSEELSGLSFPLGRWECELRAALQGAERTPCPALCSLLDGVLMAKACRGRGAPREQGWVPAASVEGELLAALRLFRQLLRTDAVLGAKELLTVSDS